jgi:cysteine synthase A
MSDVKQLLDCIGHTPLLRLNKLSEQNGCEILGKAEFLNPGGSVKDRAALGTGGTLGGVARALKRRNPDVRIALSDPGGSGLHGYFAHGIEGSSITEGIGNSRITASPEGTPIDLSWQIRDKGAIPLVFELVRDEGLVLGGSSGINICGALCLAQELGPGHTIVTILCDSALR